LFYLLKDLVEDNVKLKVLLINDLIDSKKDIKLAKKFIDMFGSEFFKELDSNVQEIFKRKVHLNETNDNVEITKNNKYHDKFYACDLDEKNIVFIDNEYEFKKMLIYFQTKNIKIIGEYYFYEIFNICSGHVKLLAVQITNFKY